MKILAFVDTHGDLAVINKLLRKSKEADILVCAGDISMFGREMEKIFKKFSELGKMMLIIPGNHEENSKINEACKKFKNIRNIHCKAFRIGKRIFLGYGGGGFSQEDKRFEICAKEFKKILKKEDEAILVTHAPPYDTKMDYIANAHVGNMSYRKGINELKPLLYICGHLHENSKKKQVVGKTLVINPGADGEILEI